MQAATTLKYRWYYTQAVIVVAAFVLIAKLAQLQLIDDRYKSQAQATTISREVEYPSRGLLYDRKGRILVHNAPQYDLLVTYRLLNPNMDTTTFCGLLGITKEDFIMRLDKDWKDKRFSKHVPFYFIKNIPADVFQRFQEHLYEFPGFTPQVRFYREYPHHSAAHILGYINEVDEKVLQDSSDTYALGDYIGVSGIEKSYEKILRGTKGISITLRDNKGNKIKTLSQGINRPPISGKDLTLSIDLKLQEYAEHLFQNKTGALVAIEPKTGEILAMVSAPGYDPNILAINRRDKNVLQQLQTDSLKPFYNRPIMASYPPASIFKPAVALIALQEGAIRPNTSVSCPGYYKYEEFRYGCHHHPKPWNVKIAIEYSCNSYFFQAFRNIIEQFGFEHHDAGLDVFVDYLYDFGFGHRLGIDLEGEASGFIPTSKFYDKLYPQYKWKSTYIMSIGIGQGELLLTPLQMANAACIIANRGKYIPPHFIRRIGNEDEGLPEKYKNYNLVQIDTSYFTPVIEGMKWAVQSGTAQRGRIPGIEVCGKTGTSQNPHGKDHSVFFAFAPEKNPEIAIAVIVENAGFGGAVATPIASLVIEKYLSGAIKRKYLENKITSLDLIHNLPQ